MGGRGMYNRYQGNSGRVERVGEPPEKEVPREVPWEAPEERRPPSPLSGLSGELGRVFRRLQPDRLETEDLLLLCVLYLLYRESGDEEFLIAMGGLLLF